MTIYKHDASGNTMATYEMKIDFEGFSQLREDYYLSEQNIYGSSRIGMIKSYIKIGERIFNGNFTGDIETGDGDIMIIHYLLKLQIILLQITKRMVLRGFIRI
jgi:hypothetical protein